MVYVVSGGIDEGKTTQMKNIYEQLGTGDGFISQKIFAGQNGFTGYEMVRLSTNEKMPLAYKAEHVPHGWDEIHRRGPFRFSKTAFDFAEGIIADIIETGTEPLFMDEIGPLELEGKGFCKTFEKALKTGKDIYIAVRSHCVEDVIKKFNIRNYELIMITGIDSPQRAQRKQKKNSATSATSAVKQ
jgi:nucleoside-triphosphatase THEP1